MTRSDNHERALRRDAAANRERVLAAASVAVRREGERVPMAAIADEAGVGIGTVYRHYPTRAALLSAVAERSWNLVLDHARTAASADGPAVDAIARFLAETIAARDDLILPLHGGPVLLDTRTLALRAEIRELLEQLLTRGRRDGSIRADATATDIIITGAMLAQPLAHVSDWDRLARRQAEIYLAGLAATPSSSPAPPRTSHAARSS
jgi:AcrR family transcriptional regulator